MYDTFDIVDFFEDTTNSVLKALGSDERVGKLNRPKVDLSAGSDWVPRVPELDLSDMMIPPLPFSAYKTLKPGVSRGGNFLLLFLFFQPLLSSPFPVFFVGSGVRGKACLHDYCLLYFWSGSCYVSHLWPTTAETTCAALGMFLFLTAFGC